ncbi:chemotaxis protein CheW [Plasticicumulans sp.]|uniref:chemotaxis protein CheW n=1 Tax=Plasticicumulans sp. TaxID=2307179 RepID=UPI002BDCAD39|nr:chemotaxis protein CheW [Plasticicumulans sp.]MBS0599997.1 purine-binding chemotaxis protein CheW [Pseudomonadota bacterium]HMW29195.1 chemotaxis protein CheW [Plasticicumulans sp.]
MSKALTAPRSAAVPAASAESRQFLTFAAGGETLALGILHVREIIEYGRVTAVPMLPAFVRGVINLRGSVVPVIDLSARLGRAPSTIGRRSCIVIVELPESDGERRELGLLVDAVSAVIDIPEIEPPPSFGARMRPDFILGMGKLDERFVVILDPTQTLSLDEMAALAGNLDAGVNGA